MKTIEFYGVEMTRYVSDKLMKYLDNNKIAMNTKTEQERKDIVIQFLTDNHIKC